MAQHAAEVGGRTRGAEDRKTPSAPPWSVPVWSLVREARHRAGISAEELASRLGLPVTEIQQYEAAQTIPDIVTLYELAAACGQDLRLTLVPHDDADDRRLAERLAMTPAQRAEINRRMVAMAAAGARARAAGDVNPHEDG